MTSCASIPEASYIEYARLLATHPLARYHQTPASQWLMGDIRHTFYNRVMQMRFDPGAADHEIDEMLARYFARRLPVAWMVGPSSQPTDLGARLRAHEMVPAGVLHGMIADLTKLPEDSPWPAGLSVQTVSDIEGLNSWVKVVARSYNQPRHIACSLFELYNAQEFSPHQLIRLFVGSVEGQPIAAALLLMGIHSAGIYNVSTLPEARRQGFGAALTRHALLDAKVLGYSIVALSSTAMGVGIYQQLGFMECCRLEIYQIKRP